MDNKTKDERISRIKTTELLSSLPREWPTDLHKVIQRQVWSSNRVVVVLDDDPTGAQTVHDVPVLTDWSLDLIRQELRQAKSVFYILTNSRSVPLSEAQIEQKGSCEVWK